MTPYRLSLRYLRTERGRKTATRSAGHSTASATAFSVAHDVPCHPGFPKSLRVAAAVAESGFHSAITANQGGIVDGSTKTFDRNPTGHDRNPNTVTTPGFAFSPLKIPTHNRLNRSNNNNPI